MKKRSIEDIIADWKVEHGIVKHGKYSNFYRCIPFERKPELMMYLVQTMLDEGFKEETIIDTDTQRLVIQYCCPPEDSGSKTLEKQKRITKAQWKDVLKEFFRGKTATELSIVPREGSAVPLVPDSSVTPPKPKKEKSVDYSKFEVEPSDMIHPDRTGFVDTMYDPEFFADFGIDPPKEGSE